MSIHRGGGPEHQERDVPTGVKITALMGRAGLSQVIIAKKYGVTRQAVSRTVWGQRSGQRLRRAIANELGFEDWTSW